MLKNTVSFILAFLLAAVVILYAVCVTAATPDFFDSFLTIEKDGTVVFMGASHSPDKQLLKSLSAYIETCKSSADFFVPHIISAPIKSAATAMITAAANAADAFNGAAEQILFGNM